MTEHRYCVQGEIDLATAHQVRSDLNRAVAIGNETLMIDCARLTFIDSTGIATLLEANGKLEAHGGHMFIVNVPPGPRRVFEALGLTDLLQYESDAG
jgi:anti-anti-sigma factor